MHWTYILIYSHTYICTYFASSQTWGPVLWSGFWTEENLLIKPEEQSSMEYNTRNLSLFFICLPFLPFPLYDFGRCASMVAVLHFFFFFLFDKTQLTCSCFTVQDGATSCEISFKSIILQNCYCFFQPSRYSDHDQAVFFLCECFV